MMVEPGAAHARALRELPARREAPLLVGPEGGWTEGELRSARDAGAVLTTLGTQTLRADAMPIVAVTAVRVLWEDF
jgi:16S rRNA (uracil1498-N3)-methyltransferase